MVLERAKQIEQLSMQILSKYHIQDNPGEHLSEIIAGENIVLIDFHDWTVEQCGRFMYFNDQPAIFYNAKHTKPMYTFTIAHELGHYFLKHLESADVEIICVERDFDRQDGNDDTKAMREVEANYFAACLLMPFNLLYPAFMRCMEVLGIKPPLYVDTQQCNFLAYRKCMRMLQVQFLASESAIRFRLMNLHLLDFRIKFPETIDRGISIAEYLENYQQNKH